ncbi:NADH-quinone oxidoreductase subunit B family protein [Novipirellula aureliae]|nr:NADP oxidoreductase [Novipirellula aureliae]
MSKPTIATGHFTGCFGCHMSLLDIDERILQLTELVEFDKSPINDKKRFNRMVDIGIIEGGCSNDENVEFLRMFRENCHTLVAIGACALTGGVPAMRNTVPLRECLEEAFLSGPSVVDGVIPNDPDIPIMLDRVYPAHEVVKIDYFIPGCPPSADALWTAIVALLEGREPVLDYELLKYD